MSTITDIRTTLVLFTLNLNLPFIKGRTIWSCYVCEHWSKGVSHIYYKAHQSSTIPRSKWLKREDCCLTYFMANMPWPRLFLAACIYPTLVWIAHISLQKYWWVWFQEATWVQLGCYTNCATYVCPLPKIPASPQCLNTCTRYRTVDCIFLLFLPYTTRKVLQRFLTLCMVSYAVYEFHFMIIKGYYKISIFF